jgi:anti-sigma factor RsiW
MTANFNDFRSNSSELDYFELLSAYIDGELAPAERDRVAEWLDSKPEIKTTYLQLLKLQTQMQKIPTPSSISVDTVSAEVFERLDRNRRKKRCYLWGGGAIVATLLATISSIVPSVNSPEFRLVNSTPNFAQPVMVAVAVNKPAVKIPKAAVSSGQERSEY